MFNTVILLAGSRDQQLALTELLKVHNPTLSFRGAVTPEELDAIHTDFVMVFSGLLLSPARIAMYSSPQSAPNIICPNSAIVRRSCGGI